MCNILDYQNASNAIIIPRKSKKISPDPDISFLGPQGWTPNAKMRYVACINIICNNFIKFKSLYILNIHSTNKRRKNASYYHKAVSWKVR